MSGRMSAGRWWLDGQCSPNSARSWLSDLYGGEAMWLLVMVATGAGGWVENSRSSTGVSLMVVVAVGAEEVP